MREDRRSFYKTILVACGVGVASISVAETIGSRLFEVLPEPVTGIVRLILWGIGCGLLGVAAAGALVTYRDLRSERGHDDLFDRLNQSRSEAAIVALRNAQHGRVPLPWLRQALGAPRFLVGQRVRIRGLDEIMAGLDQRGSLGGLPFMPEMARFCRQEARVFRYVDKIYDYGGRKDLRRLANVVSLAGLRCDGSAHDTCEAGCYLLWRTEWLQDADVAARARTRAGGEYSEVPAPAASLGVLGQYTRQHGPEAGPIRYFCQYTELVRASKPMSTRDIRQDIRPLIAGNVTFAAFFVALLTRWFNLAQRKRGGIGFPSIRPAPGGAQFTACSGLAAGDRVRVLDSSRIASTLTSGRHKGLWFDSDMVRHCGRTYRVLRLVSRIIDDATGRMLQMKTPCLILEGVSASGESLRFTAQHDYPFWREDWLTNAEDRSSQDLRDRSVSREGIRVAQ